MSSERKVPEFRPLEEAVRGVLQIDTEALNQQIETQKRSQIITPELWNLRVTI
jgi:hypothetical protein